MRNLTKFLATTAVAAAAVAVATAGHAAQFASFNHAPTGAFTFTNNGGTEGDISVTNADVLFSFQWPGLTTGAIDATFNFTGVTTDPATDPGLWQQTGIDGTFSFVANQAFSVGGNNFGAGTVLLAGTYDNGWIQGIADSGSLNTTTLAFNGNVTYSSGAIPAISGAIPPRSFSLSLNEVNPNFNAGQGDVLDSFTADVTGSFSAAGVPEPATWALMILGFGSAGAMLRSRRRAAVAA